MTASASQPQLQSLDAAKETAFGEYVSEEYVTPVECNVTGNLPEWLKGTMYTNGPGMTVGMHHLFSGYGLIRKMKVKDGKAFYQSRFVESKAYKYWKETGNIGYGEFGTESNCAEDKGLTDNAGVTVQTLEDTDQLLAMSETAPSYYILDKETLDTVRQVDIGSDGMNVMLQTAHGQLLPDGRFINIATKPSPPDSRLEVTVQHGPIGPRKSVAKIPPHVPYQPAWQHDVACTDKHVLVPDHPFSFRPEGNDLEGFAILKWLGDDVEHGIHHVVDLESGEYESFKAPKVFCYHYLNAFEKIETIQVEGESHQVAFFVVDAPLHSRPKSINDFFLYNLRSPDYKGDSNVLTRLQFPLKLASHPIAVQDHVRSLLTTPYDIISTPLLEDESKLNFFEFGMVHPDKKYSQYRYAYGIAQQEGDHAGIGTRLVKIDTLEGKLLGSWYEAGSLCTEPVIVPKPGSEGEDDVVALSIVFLGGGEVGVVVFDCSTMTEMARIQWPSRVQYSFHSCFDVL